MFETLVTMVGWVVGDITCRRYGDNQKVVHFRMATQERRYDRESGDWVDGDRMFISVKCWRKLGENVLTSLRRGDPVVVTGRLHHREYESDSQHRLSVELDAYSLGPDLARCQAPVDRIRPTTQPPTVQLPLTGSPAIAEPSTLASTRTPAVPSAA